MTEWSTNKIRSAFLEYFQENGHTIVESSSLVPHGDPTLLFTNAGMNQFKDLFLGNEKRDYVRATSSQKCVRAGGKHNDLENVGFTARHHTFFEMLGNFSFGDYFKSEAIKLAWHFITETLSIDKDRLYVTVYNDDDEAADIWHQQEGVPKDRISRFGEKDNFWQMGDTGPCGPCTEIFYDYGPEVGCKSPDCKVGCECDRFTEIWNNVFMQFNRDDSGKLTALPKPSVDTGMGLERIASVMQGKTSNYETDLFQDLISAIEKVTGSKYEGQARFSFHVIADHLRAGSFLIADGVLPSNEGRGYVLRRILRRGIRHGNLLGVKEPFFHKLTDTLIAQMGDAFPEIKDKKSFINEVFENEEKNFLLTLERGLALLNIELGIEVSGDSAKIKKLSGETVFKLYDTFGFPPDLTATISTEHGVELDMEGYDLQMQAQKKRSGGFSGTGEVTTEQVYHELLGKIKNDGVSIEFTGYESTHEAESNLLYVIHEGKILTELDSDGEKLVELVFEKTPFYAESGGQVGDTGLITSGETEVIIQDTQKPIEGLFIMKGILKSGSLKSGNKFSLSVDEKRRKKIILNHSATHLLHSALRSVFGDHVKQAGSHVSEDRLRFDYTHFQQVGKEQLDKIEAIVDEKIKEKISATKEVLPKDEALKKGAIAFFGDKYGDQVRVVSMGDFSVEFCGGTHVDNTADIGVVKIVADQSISSGVRRLEAVSSQGVFEYLASMNTNIDGKGSIRETENSINKELKEINTSVEILKGYDSAAALEFANPLKEKESFLSSVVPGFQEIHQSFSSEITSENPETLINLKSQYSEKYKKFFSDLRSEQKNIQTLRKSIDKKLKSFQQKHSAEQAGDWISDKKVISTSKGDINILVKKVELDSPKALRETADQVISKMKSGIVVFGLPAGGRGHLLVAADKSTVELGFHSGNALKEICELMNGRGGGKPHLAQGGGDEGGLENALEKAQEIIASQFT